jgi:hypothetical protein
VRQFGAALGRSAKRLATSQEPFGSPQRPIHRSSPGMVILFDIEGTLIDHDTAETIAVAA